MGAFGDYHYQESAQSVLREIAGEQEALAFKIGEGVISGAELARISLVISDLEGALAALEMMDHIVERARDDQSPMSIGEDEDALIERFRQESFPYLVDNAGDPRDDKRSDSERSSFAGFCRTAGMIVNVTSL